MICKTWSLVLLGATFGLFGCSSKEEKERIKLAQGEILQGTHQLMWSNHSIYGSEYSVLFEIKLNGVSFGHYVNQCSHSQSPFWKGFTAVEGAYHSYYIADDSVYRDEAMREKMSKVSRRFSWYNDQTKERITVGESMNVVYVSFCRIQ